jgi:hypothetical protein
MNSLNKQLESSPIDACIGKNIHPFYIFKFAKIHFKAKFENEILVLIFK